MNLVKYILLIKQWALSQHAKKSYSQEGEDLILERIFEGQSKGFYIDVGAHHPLRFSNTYLLYKRGWSGINIDATPGTAEAFNLIRPRDINLEVAIGKLRKTREFYTFNEPAINTFDKVLAKHSLNVGYKLVSTKKIKIVQLKQITSRYAKNIDIDLLTIDVEGLDLEVLYSIDWTKRPRVIAVESLGSDMDSPKSTKTYQYLSKNDYRLIAKTANTLIFLSIK